MLSEQKKFCSPRHYWVDTTQGDFTVQKGQSVLGLARTGLIFTGIQEGAQPGGGGWPHLAKQSPVFYTMCRHGGFRWGGRRGGKALAAWVGAAPVLFRESGCCTVRGCVFSLFVSFLFLFSLYLLFC